MKTNDTIRRDHSALLGVTLLPPKKNPPKKNIRKKKFIGLSFLHLSREKEETSTQEKKKGERKRSEKRGKDNKDSEDEGRRWPLKTDIKKQPQRRCRRRGHTKKFAGRGDGSYCHALLNTS
jgi:hypothetical protein